MPVFAGRDLLCSPFPDVAAGDLMAGVVWLLVRLCEEDSTPISSVGPRALPSVSKMFPR